LLEAQHGDTQCEVIATKLKLKPAVTGIFAMEGNEAELYDVVIISTESKNLATVFLAHLLLHLSLCWKRAFKSFFRAFSSAAKLLIGACVVLSRD
jgi:hypothetical protein